MDSTALVNGFDAEAGRKAVDAFDLAKLEIRAALWFYHSDSKNWRLVLATPLYDSGGPREAYSRVSDVLDQASLAVRIPLANVAVVSPDHPLIKLLRVMYGPGVGDVRLVNTAINGVLIDDAYIYRIT